MLSYIGKRILMMIPVLVGVSFIIFMVMSFTPGDPAMMILGESASEEAIAQLRDEMGLNDPVIVQYLRYLWNSLHGDMGASYHSGEPVIREVASRFPNTLRITVWGTLLSVVIGIPVGIISAVKQYRLVDNVSLIVSLILTSMPTFWLGLLLILYFSLYWDLLPVTGLSSWKHLILPSFALAASSLGSLIRMTRSTMLEVIRADYIRTARAKGAAERAVIFGHALRNALLPIVTVVGLNFGRQMGGAIVTENVFAIPGIGTLMINGVRQRDTPMVMASILFAALMAGFVNLLVDIVYSYIDPRLKSQFAKK